MSFAPFFRPLGALASGLVLEDAADEIAEAVADDLLFGVASLGQEQAPAILAALDRIAEATGLDEISEDLLATLF